LRDRPRRFLLVSVGTIFRTDNRVFNKTTSFVEITVDVKFDESNGSQREQVSENFVDDEEPSSVSIFRMGTGEVMPCEVQVQALVDTSYQ
jgi:hypothetical protein